MEDIEICEECKATVRNKYENIGVCTEKCGYESCTHCLQTCLQRQRPQDGPRRRRGMRGVRVKLGSQKVLVHVLGRIHQSPGHGIEMRFVLQETLLRAKMYHMREAGRAYSACWVQFDRERAQAIQGAADFDQRECEKVARIMLADAQPDDEALVGNALDNTGEMQAA